MFDGKALSLGVAYDWTSVYILVGPWNIEIARPSFRFK